MDTSLKWQNKTYILLYNISYQKEREKVLNVKITSPLYTIENLPWRQKCPNSKKNKRVLDIITMFSTKILRIDKENIQ